VDRTAQRDERPLIEAVLFGRARKADRLTVQMRELAIDNAGRDASRECDWHDGRGISAASLTPYFSCEHTITLAAKPHPKSACQLQRSLGGPRVVSSAPPAAPLSPSKYKDSERSNQARQQIRMLAINPHTGAVRRHSAKVNGNLGRPRRIGSSGLIFLHLSNALVQPEASFNLECPRETGVPQPSP